MIKVLHINSFSQAGGAEQVAVDLLKSPFVESKLIVKGNGLVHGQIIEFHQLFSDRFIAKLDKLCWRIGFRNDFKKLFSISERFNYTYRKLKKTAAYREADIIHLHNIHGNYFDLSALKKIAREKKILWTLHDMWAVTGGEFYTYENLNYRKGIGKTPVDYLYPLQSPLIDLRQHDLELKKKLYVQLAGRITLVPVSQWLNQVVKSAYVYNNQLALKTIYNGVDTGVFFNQSLRDWNKPRVLFFNAGGESKASWLFLNILEKVLLPFELFVIGNNIAHPSISYYKPFIRDRNELMQLYNTVDILVFPSKAETFGLVPLEAMACGVCVIAADTTALPELITPDVGYTFTSGNQEHLLRQMQLCLSDLQGCRKKGVVAAKWAATTFGLENCHKAYFQLYEQIIRT